LKELEPLFNPRSVAVVGATNNWNKWGYSTFASALNGFCGPVYPVNNTESEVLGHEVFRLVRILIVNITVSGRRNGVK